MNASGVAVADIFHQSLPADWRERADNIANQQEHILLHVLEEYDKAKEEKEKTPSKRLRRGVAWLLALFITLLLGVILGPYAEELLRLLS